MELYKGALVTEGRKGGWMQTYTGRAVWPLDMRVEDIDIRDIARSLSMQCRYLGHTKERYSIAEHSVYVAELVPPELALDALLHDASEAYLVDVPRPVKPFLIGYFEMEAAVEKVIAEKYNLVYPMHPEIKLADTRMLLCERDQLLSEPPLDWMLPEDLVNPNIEIYGWSPLLAERIFLDRFDELMRKRIA